MSLAHSDAIASSSTLRELQHASDRPGAWLGQCGQDYIVASIFRGARDLFFVDLAANEPIRFSNTRALERSPGPLASGDPVSANNKLQPEAMRCSIGMVRRPKSAPLTPSPASYDARSLYWSGKKPLGRSGLRARR